MAHVFLSYTQGDDGARKLIRAFKKSIKAWRKRNKRHFDPWQVVRAHLSSAWWCLQDMSDKKWDVAADNHTDEIHALSMLFDKDAHALDDMDLEEYWVKVRALNENASNNH